MASGDAVIVQKDAHSDPVCIPDDLVHNFEAGQTFKVAIDPIVDAGGDRRIVQQLIGERQADQVEAEVAHVAHHAAPFPRPKALRREIGRFQAEPVYPM